MICARVAGVPRPRWLIASRSSCVFDELPCTFHRGEQCALRKARGRFGLVFGDFDVAGIGGFAFGDAAKCLLAVSCGLFPVDGQPAGIDDDLALALEGFSFNAGDPEGNLELGRRIEDSDEAPGDHVKDLHLELIEIPCRNFRRDDGMVISDLRIVKNALVWPNPSVGKSLLRMRAKLRIFKLGQNGLGIAKIILGKISRIGPRIRQNLVTFVEGLGNLECGARLARSGRWPRVGAW